MHKDEIEKHDYFPQELIEKMARLSVSLSGENTDPNTAIDELITCCQFLAKRVRELEAKSSPE